MEHENQEAAALAVAELHHAWLTGLVLALIVHRDPETAERFVFQLFRRQHTERFLPGLKKLGLDTLPHAVAAARYHYFSNQLGGVNVEYLEVAAHKAWIRYPPPRWIWSGTALCAIPSNVNRAMLRGWHAHNGVTLGNPRLGFVCTGTTVDGAPGLEGYYLEYDHDLEPAERLRFVNDERCPPIDPAGLPQLDQHGWPALRQAKAYRNYAMEYVRNALPLLIDELGPARALEIGARAGRQIGMQLYGQIAARLAIESTDADAYVDLFARLLAAAGDAVSTTGSTVTRADWRLFNENATGSELRELWRAPYAGLLAAHNRFLSLGETAPGHFTVSARPD